ncbi:MAG: hypothetical protein WKF34_07190 [Pyrinomonadaceae bacterium]
MLDPDGQIFSQKEVLGLKPLTSKMVLSMARQVEVPTANWQNSFAFSRDNYREGPNGKAFYRVADFCFVSSNSLYLDGFLKGPDQGNLYGDLGSQYVYEKPRQ